jgi:hypothetical protein
MNRNTFFMQWYLPQPAYDVMALPDEKATGGRKQKAFLFQKCNSVGENTFSSLSLRKYSNYRRSGYARPGAIHMQPEYANHAQAPLAQAMIIPRPFAIPRVGHLPWSALQAEIINSAILPCHISEYA